APGLEKRGSSRRTRACLRPDDTSVTASRIGKHPSHTASGKDIQRGAIGKRVTRGTVAAKNMQGFVLWWQYRESAPGESSMAHPSLDLFIRYVRKVTGAHPGEGLADGQLLDRFVSAQDQAAFATLMERHSGIVWRVCRGMLHDPHDVEDAFQAT